MGAFSEEHSDRAAISKMDPVRIFTDHRITQSGAWQANTSQIGPQRFPGHFGSLLHAFRVALTWGKADVLISANIRNAALFCLMRRLWPNRAPEIMVLEVRLDDPQQTLAWRAKRAFQRFSLPAVSLICVSAKREIDIYSNRLGVSPDRFRFVPWHTNVLNPAATLSEGGYIFSAGRTGRDWRTFFCAVRELKERIVVVCGQNSAPPSEDSAHVDIFMDVSYQRYRELLEGAKIVVVSLEEHVYSSGQVALLEAMALGKAVIATDCIGTEDYITHEENGLLVEPACPEALRNALSRMLSDSALQKRITENALKSVLKAHTLDTYVSLILAHAYELARER